MYIRSKDSSLEKELFSVGHFFSTVGILNRHFDQSNFSHVRHLVLELLEVNVVIFVVQRQIMFPKLLSCISSPRHRFYRLELAEKASNILGPSASIFLHWIPFKPDCGTEGNAGETFLDGPDSHRFIGFCPTAGISAVTISFYIDQGRQSVGSIRFPNLIPTEISGIGSCSDPEINFYSQIGSGSFLVVQIISRDRSKLKVYPEFIGHPKFYK